MHRRSVRDVSREEKRASHSVRKTESDNNAGGCSLDCNICLDSANDPVVTFCGHLYCWSCIYIWFRQVQCSSNQSAAADHHHPKCPVCKAYISKSTLVPLYGGRGDGLTPSEHSVCSEYRTDPSIPLRPPAISVGVTIDNSAPNLIRNHQLQPNDVPHNQPPPPSYNDDPYFHHSFGGSDNSSIEESDGTTLARFFRPPTVGIFGEIFFQIMFGVVGANLVGYHGFSGMPRMGRHEMQADKCLNRLYIFLLCCFLLCLLLS